MAHKALLVGINKYPGAPLQGCVNDVHDMAAYLTAHRGFASTDISLLLDHAATTRAISKALKTLVAGVKPGDRVLFHYSGHGAQVPTRNPAGEIDGLDECICITGDTKIPMLDGTEKTISELAQMTEPFWVYSADATGQVHPGQSVRAWKTGDNKPVLKVTLDNGESVRCTPNHRWMLRDGTYRQAQDLVPGDSLMPLYRNERRHKNGRLSYETVWNLNTQTYDDTHRIVAGSCPEDILVRSEEQGCGVVVHHRNFNSRDNRPGNLQWMTWKDHVELHTQSVEHRAASSARSKKLWSDPVYRELMLEKQVQAAYKRWEDLEYRAKISAASKGQDLSAMREGAERYLESLTHDERASRSAKAGKANKGQPKPESYKEKLRARWQDPAYREKMCAAQSAAMKRRWQDPEAREKMMATIQAANNHKIVSVESDGAADVYDMTVPQYSNFAVSAGVFLHNCPVDFDWMDAHMIRDKDFHALFSTIPAGVDFVWVSDSCHSGDLSKAMPRPMTTSRAFPAPDHIAWEIAQAKSQGVRSRSLGTASLPLNVALVSGCKSDQTSADAFFGHRYNGALSYYLLQTLAKVGDSMPLQALVPQVALALQKNGYEQVPQWEGSAELAARKFLSA